MSEEFKPIETQEDFNKALLSALRGNKERIEADYSDYEALKAKAAENEAAKQGYKDKIAALEAEKNAAILNSCRIQCAQKYGLHPGDAERLKGSTPEEIEADAQGWADSIRSRRSAAPGASHDGGTISESMLEYSSSAREALNQLRVRDY